MVIAFEEVNHYNARNIEVHGNAVIYRYEVKEVVNPTDTTKVDMAEDRTVTRLFTSTELI